MGDRAMTNREPLFRVAWKRKDADGEEVEGHTRPAPKFIAEKLCAAANRQFPETEHWIEEVSADE
jgi:hypothetical protein